MRLWRRRICDCWPRLGEGPAGGCGILACKGFATSPCLNCSCLQRGQAAGTNASITRHLWGCQSPVLACFRHPGCCSNTKLSEQYLSLARDLDVMEAKTPEDVYKMHLVEGRAPTGELAPMPPGSRAVLCFAVLCGWEWWARLPDAPGVEGRRTLVCLVCADGSLPLVCKMQLAATGLPRVLVPIASSLLPHPYVNAQALPWTARAPTWQLPLSTRL